jgi:hypothetical protein
VTDEDLIASYKLELTSEAELARGDLDEIEDHLRVLARELRDQGMPRVEAVAEACRRLGEPRAVAREHARVRSPFGARLAKLRAYSAVALWVPLLISGAVTQLRCSGLVSLFGLQLAFGALLALALGFRLSWARPIVLGAVACLVARFAILSAIVVHPPVMWCAAYVGILAFVMPWRRGELSTSGLALALQVWAVGSAAFALEFQITSADGSQVMAVGALIAFFAAAAATIGGVLRARWGAIASLVAAPTLALAMAEVLPLRFRFPFPLATQLEMTGLLVSGALAATVAAILSWRAARSTFGTLQSVLH